MTDPHAMAFNGDVVGLRHFLAPLPKPATANTVSAYRKTTMLCSATRSGHLSVVRMLVGEVGASSASGPGGTAAARPRRDRRAVYLTTLRSGVPVVSNRVMP
jgi:hypothetical protein